MRHLALGLAAALWAAQPASACTDQMSDRDLAQTIEELSQADLESGSALAQIVRGKLDSGVRDYCAGYHLARYMTLAGNYEGARDYLLSALDVVTQKDLETTAPWNIMGYTLLQQSDLSGALRSFIHQIEYPTFAVQPEGTRMKTLNNAGFVALKSGQYELAIKLLSQARDLGSSTAERNLLIAQSILETQKSGEIDAPGVFSTVLGSWPSPDLIKEKVDEFAAKLGSRDEISVFISSNGSYTITYGAYESYPKSEARQKQARELDFENPYTTSMADWQDVTAEFLDEK